MPIPLNPTPRDVPSHELVYLPELSVDPNAPLPSQLSSTRVRVRPFQDHVDALTGPALDPLHLLLRSTLPKACFQSEQRDVVAAILKAEHDLAVLRGVDLSLASPWARPLRADLERLQELRPSAATLKAPWHAAVSALEGCLLPRATAA